MMPANAIGRYVPRPMTWPAQIISNNTDRYDRLGASSMGAKLAEFAFKDIEDEKNKVPGRHCESSEAGH